MEGGVGGGHTGVMVVVLRLRGQDNGSWWHRTTCVDLLRIVAGVEVTTRYSRRTAAGVEVTARYRRTVEVTPRYRLRRTGTLIGVS